MSEESLVPRYRSGTAVTMRVRDVRFDFGHDDFVRRVIDAAAHLGLVEAHRVDADEAADLVAIALRGTADAPASALARHLADRDEVLRHDGRGLAHWLRRLVLRGAWLDQRVADGHLEPRFVPGRGFTHRSARTGAPAAEGLATPDWSAHAYRRAAA